MGIATGDGTNKTHFKISLMFVNLKIKCLITGGWQEDNASNYHIKIQNKENPRRMGSVGAALSGGFSYQSMRLVSASAGMVVPAIGAIMASSLGVRSTGKFI